MSEEVKEGILASERKLEKKWKNKQRTLLLAARGVSHRHRHLMQDLFELMPHGKKDVKIEKKEENSVVNELCYMNSCNNGMYFQIRKRELYLWVVRTPQGPSALFHVQNVHTKDELKLTGNCLKGSRPMLSFDASFDEDPHMQVIKELLTQVMGTPKNHPKSKPFVDHVFSFNNFDGRIWFRNYQVIEKDDNEDKANPLNLVEIGPRFCMQLVKIFEGSMSGKVLYKNPSFMTRTKAKKMKNDASKYAERLSKKRSRKEYAKQAEYEEDELNEIFQA